MVEKTLIKEEAGVARAPRSFDIAFNGEPRHGHLIWIGILVLSVLIRIAWMAAVPVIPVSDSYAYDTFAHNLANGAGYCWEPGALTAYWPVGTSFIYSICYRVFGQHYPPIIVLNILLGVGITALTMHLGRIWFGSRVALVAGLFMAFWPSQVEFTTVLASELPFTFFVLLACTVLWSKRLNWMSSAAIAGVILAAASYVRPTAMALPVVLAVALIMIDQKYAKVIARTAIMLLVMVICIAPWTIRNYHLFNGKLVPIAANSGTNFWMGNNPQSSGEYMNDFPAETISMNEAERDQYLGAEAKAYIRAHPIRFIGRSIVKAIRLHDRESIGVSWNAEGLSQRFPASMVQAIKVGSSLYWWGGLCLAFIGMILFARWRGLWAAASNPAVLLWAYFTAVHAITVIQDRYHFPSIPGIAMLAGVAVAAWLPGAAQTLAGEVVE
ncbi:MAG: glycosyltransferase family 39 protein [Phycisphaerales bacterium]|nr:glycosyltransferase family 39 protein [Phycisphaerales bacterium]